MDHLIQHTLHRFRHIANYDFAGEKKTSYREKVRNEKEVQKLIDDLTLKIKPYRNTNLPELSSTETEELKNTVTASLLAFDQKQPFLDKPFLKFFIDLGYLEVTEAFIARAGKEDRGLTAEEVFQAIRNVWIMNSLQIMWGLPLELTPSIYAYSMLYPYTDNFLDDPHIDLQDKNRFTHKLTKVLKGEKQIPSNDHEGRVFELIQEIESQYDRKEFPQVYESILLIQEAQIESLKQDQERRMTEEEILPISFFKGGASVLADAFLVKGSLSEKESIFSFEYGTFLQLLDDLQDAVKDKADGHQTIFSIKDKRGGSDTNIEKLMAYIFKANAPVHEDAEAMVFMKEVVRTFSLLLVMDAVGKNPSVVSRKLYKRLASYSKVRLTFHKKIAESEITGTKLLKA